MAVEDEGPDTSDVYTLAMLSTAHDPVRILEALSSCPTAPFYEAYVARRILAFCKSFGLEHEVDRFGNVVAWHRGADRGDVAAQPIAFAAHMDHPAFEVVSTSPVRGLLLGGIRAPHFERVVPVRLICESGEVRGQIVGCAPTDQGLGLEIEAEAAVPAGAFGVFDVGPFREENGLLYQPAADDLAGCAATLSALARCTVEGTRVDAAGVFTRAEEVGLIGATLVAEQRLLPANTLVISLEASRELPGALIGGGPVIRVGDAATCFHPEGDALLQRARRCVLERDASARVQRQLMSGGTCEATAYALCGYTTGGVAFPLGNYHNSGPDCVISPEYVHRHDLETGAELLFSAACVAADGARSHASVEALRRRAHEAAERLAQSATYG